jgi:BolA family transcriptional regulator, general stress-responsive regulator
LPDSAATLVTLRQRLAPLAPLRLDIEDDSHLHAGHAGAREGGHFRLLVVSTQFAGKNTMARHRLVYGLLGDLKQIGVHAISLTACAPDEV